MYKEIKEWNAKQPTFGPQLIIGLEKRIASEKQHDHYGPDSWYKVYCRPYFVQDKTETRYE